MGKDDAAGKSKETNIASRVARHAIRCGFDCSIGWRRTSGISYSWDRCHCAADDIRFNWLLPLFLATTADQLLSLSWPKQWKWIISMTLRALANLGRHRSKRNSSHGEPTIWRTGFSSLLAILSTRQLLHVIINPIYCRRFHSLARSSFTMTLSLLLRQVRSACRSAMAKSR